VSNDPINPYAPPQTSTWVEEPEGSFHGLRRRSVLLMILLTVLTLGLYINYWVHQLALAVNQRLKRHHMSMGLVAFYWILSVTSLLWLIPEIVTDDDPMVLRIGTMITRLEMIFALIMAFAIRSRLNTLTLVPREHPAWFHGLWTFLFGIFYLQWKTNRNHQSSELPAHKTSAPATPDFDFLSEQDSSGGKQGTSK